METPQEQQPFDFYVDILEEIKARIEIISMAINGKLGTGLTPPFLREISYLQLRMICELIAIGCLTAHGNEEFTLTNSIQKAYEADKIMNRLEQLHPDFYPHPVKLTITKDNVHMDRIEEAYLTKIDLLNLYHECGEKLHRGRLKTFKETSEKMKEPDLSDIFGWGNKLLILLREHHIASKDNLTHYICVLRYKEMAGHACAWIAKSPVPN